jgi:XTP/dITP diphosphohydrolase
MTFPERIVLATRNEHKIRELGRICTDWPVTWITLRDPEAAAAPEVEETGETYLDNALLKARAVSEALGLPALADDSGIELDALGGAPGPRSARLAGPTATDEENLHALLGALKGIPAGGRTARYRCVAALAEPGGTVVHAEATCEGSVVGRASGSRGFGYDPVFVPVGWDTTMAELTDEEKDRISHRGKAFRALRDLLADAADPPIPGSR